MSTTIRIVLSAALLGCAFPASAEVLISQYYEGASNNKWIELANTEGTPVSLDGYVITNWANSGAEIWKSDGGSPTNFENLNGSSIAGNGFLLIGNASAVLPAYAMADLTSAATNFNGNDSVVLYNTALGAVGSTAAVVDAVALTDSGNEGLNKSFYRLNNDVGYDLTAGSSVLDYPAVWAAKSNAEVDDAQSSDPWYLHNFTASVTDGLTVTLNPASIAENGGTGLVDVTVTRTGATASALDIELQSSDLSEAVIPAPNRRIPAGQATETFTMAIDAVDDALADGTQTVTITASSPGFTSGTASLSVTDDGDVQPLAINEILADPASGAEGDSNRDGVTNGGEDEFVELVNISGAELDISFWVLHDGAGLKHTFPPGTVLGPGCAVVVFGGGSTDFLGGSTIYQIASNPDNGSLGLNNEGDTVTVFDELFNPIASHTYGAEGAVDESVTRDPDLTGAFVRHGIATGSTASSSPGTLVDGAEFCPPAGELTITLSAPSMSENGGSIIATISRSGSLAPELELIVRIDDATEAEADLFFPDFEVIPAGAASVDVTINAVDDIAPDGPQTVTITARAQRYTLGIATFEVLDDGDAPFTAFVINEIHHDPAPAPGGDANGDGVTDGSQDEFVELVNVSGTDFDLSGFQLLDGFGLRHVFPFGTIVANGQAILVFGGGAPTGTFGGSVVQIASTGMLGLNNGGDSVILAAPEGSELLRVEYGSGVIDQSWTRDPDLTGGFVGHTGAAGSGGVAYSPGRMLDGSAFEGGTTDPTGIALVSIAVDKGSSSVTVRISGLVPGVTYDFQSSEDLGEADPFLFLTLFITDDGTEVSPGVYEFVFSDPAIATASSQYYRIAQF